MPFDQNMLCYAIAVTHVDIGRSHAVVTATARLAAALAATRIVLCGPFVRDEGKLKFSKTYIPPRARPPSLQRQRRPDAARPALGSRRGEASLAGPGSVASRVLR